jgi:hypothetical protein
MKHHLSTLTWLIGSALISNSALATQSWFEVEVILFERLGEKSSEQFISAIKQFNLENTLTVQDDAVFGLLQDCPQLSQFERFSLLPTQDIALINVASVNPLLVKSQNSTAAMTATNDLELEIPPEMVAKQCIAPNDNLLKQAFIIQAQRLSDNGQDITAPNTAPIVDNQLPLQEPSLSEQLIRPPTDMLNELVTFDPSIFVPFPVSFSFNGTQYESVPKPAAIKTLPLTIKQTHEVVAPSVNASLDLDGNQVQDTTSLIHNPDAPYLLDDAHLEMTELAKKFRWQKSTKPLLHIGWRQPMLARHLAKPIHLFAGKDFSADFDVLGNDKHAQESQIDADEEAQATFVTQAFIKNENIQETSFLPSVKIIDIVAQLTLENNDPIQSPIWQLDGLLKIYLNHFLFIESDFDLRKVEQVKVNKEIEDNAIAFIEEDAAQPVSLITKTEQLTLDTNPVNHDISQFVTKLTSHPMKQHRKVRSTEIHYFDHPTMGMVIQIRRFKIPEVEQVAVNISTP